MLKKQIQRNVKRLFQRNFKFQLRLFSDKISDKSLNMFDEKNIEEEKGHHFYSQSEFENLSMLLSPQNLQDITDFIHTIDQIPRQSIQLLLKVISHQLKRSTLPEIRNFAENPNVIKTFEQILELLQEKALDNELVDFYQIIQMMKMKSGSFFKEHYQEMNNLKSQLIERVKSENYDLRSLVKIVLAMKQFKPYMQDLRLVLQKLIAELNNEDQIDQLENYFYIRLAQIAAEIRASEANDILKILINKKEKLLSLPLRDVCQLFSILSAKPGELLKFFRQHIILQIDYLDTRNINVLLTGINKSQTQYTDFVKTIVEVAIKQCESHPNIIPHLIFLFIKQLSTNQGKYTILEQIKMLKEKIDTIPDDVLLSMNKINFIKILWDKKFIRKRIQSSVECLFTKINDLFYENKSYDYCLIFNLIITHLEVYKSEGLLDNLLIHKNKQVIYHLFMVYLINNEPIPEKLTNFYLENPEQTEIPNIFMRLPFNLNDSQQQIFMKTFKVRMHVSLLSFIDLEFLPEFVVSISTLRMLMSQNFLLTQKNIIQFKKNLLDILNKKDLLDQDEQQLVLFYLIILLRQNFDMVSVQVQSIKRIFEKMRTQTFETAYIQQIFFQVQNYFNRVSSYDFNSISKAVNEFFNISLSLKIQQHRLFFKLLRNQLTIKRVIAKNYFIQFQEDFNNKQLVEISFYYKNTLQFHDSDKLKQIQQELFEQYKNKEIQNIFFLYLFHIPQTELLPLFDELNFINKDYFDFYQVNIFQLLIIKSFIEKDSTIMNKFLEKVKGRVIKIRDVIKILSTISSFLNFEILLKSLKLMKYFQDSVIQSFKIQKSLFQLKDKLIFRLFVTDTPLPEFLQQYSTTFWPNQYIEIFKYIQYWDIKDEQLQDYLQKQFFDQFDKFIQNKNVQANILMYLNYALENYEGEYLKNILSQVSKKLEEQQKLYLYTDHFNNDALNNIELKHKEQYEMLNSLASFDHLYFNQKQRYSTIENLLKFVGLNCQTELKDFNGIIFYIEQQKQVLILNDRVNQLQKDLVDKLLPGYEIVNFNYFDFNEQEDSIKQVEYLISKNLIQKDIEDIDQNNLIQFVKIQKQISQSDGSQKTNLGTSEEFLAEDVDEFELDELDLEEDLNQMKSESKNPETLNKEESKIKNEVDEKTTENKQNDKASKE